MDELEKQLSDVLHDLTPEPPTSYSFTPLDEVGPGAGVARRLDVRRRGPRTAPLLAAAAVVVLGAGIAVAAIGHSRTDPAPGTARVPVCRDDDLAVDTEDPVVGRGEARVRVDIGNASAVTCRLRSEPYVGVVQDIGSRTPQTSYSLLTPRAGDLVLDSGAQLVVDVRASIRGTCRQVDPTTMTGLGLAVVTQAGVIATSPLGLIGCVLTATSARVRTEP